MLLKIDETYSLESIYDCICSFTFLKRRSRRVILAKVNEGDFEARILYIENLSHPPPWFS